MESLSVFFYWTKTNPDSERSEEEVMVSELFTVTSVVTDENQHRLGVKVCLDIA